MSRKESFLLSPDPALFHALYREKTFYKGIYFPPSTSLPPPSL